MRDPEYLVVGFGCCGQALWRLVVKFASPANSVLKTGKASDDARGGKNVNLFFGHYATPLEGTASTSALTNMLPNCDLKGEPSPLDSITGHHEKSPNKESPDEKRPKL